MYFSVSIVIFALLLVFVFATSRRRSAIKKVCFMDCCEKRSLLNTLLEPYGYCCPECEMRCSFVNALSDTGLSRLSSRIFYRIFLLLTRPFTTIPDRLLCLYYLLPFAFHRLLRLADIKGTEPDK